MGNDWVSATRYIILQYHWLKELFVFLGIYILRIIWYLYVVLMIFFLLLGGVGLGLSLLGIEYYGMLPVYSTTLLPATLLAMVIRGVLRFSYYGFLGKTVMRL